MDFTNLPSNHFLAQPRPDPLQSHITGLVDTTTLAAHDFDVDNRTGFMPPQPPLRRLPPTWEIWESNLDAATSQRLQLAERTQKMELQQRIVEIDKSRVWRSNVAKVRLRYECLNLANLVFTDAASLNRRPQVLGKSTSASTSRLVLAPSLLRSYHPTT